MKWLKYCAIVFSIILVIILVLYFLYHLKSDKLNREEKNINFQNLIGVYQIDKSRTNFLEYENRVNQFENLTIKLNGDSSFEFNMSVPFIYDTIGKWYCSGNNLDELNYLVFDRNKKIKTQFTQLYFDKGDSVFYLNSNTPRVGQSSVNEVYFKKR
jgi:hypothetical protein